MNSMNNSSIHISKFGYFYAYCDKNHNNKIKREISKLKEIVNLTNSLDAKNNNIYNKKLFRKQKRMEALLKSIANKRPEFLLEFMNEYSSENKDIKKETDPLIIARHIAQSFFDIYYVKTIRKSNIVSKKNNYKTKENDIILTLTEQEVLELKNKNFSDEKFTAFLSELKKSKFSNINRQVNTLNNILQIEVKKDESKEEYEKKINILSRYANYNIDIIFKKGRNYPFRKSFIKILSRIIYIYNIKERKLDDLSECIKKSLYSELLDKYNSSKTKENKKKNYGYEIPKDTSTTTLIKVNEDLTKEKNKLIEKYNKGEQIKFDKPFSNNIQSKKVNMINSFFDQRFEFNLNYDSSEDEFVKVIIDLCELADEITDDLFKKVLFDAHDSSNLSTIQSYEKNEAIRTLYNLYSPTEKLDKYEQIKNKFEKVFKVLLTTKKENIYKLVYEKKQKKHLSISELVTSRETILNNLVIRETKFIESHAVEEFKHKALNRGKYLNYDLEIVARDIDIDELPSIYQKIKRNITYTNFVEEIKPGEDREKKYKEAKNIQKKTLAIAQEMIAKTILNKRYDREYDVSYDSYQNILDSIYENVLHEERLLHSYENIYDENEELETNYENKKKIWDENSDFVKALYLVISKKEG